MSRGDELSKERDCAEAGEWRRLLSLTNTSNFPSIEETIKRHISDLENRIKKSIPVEQPPPLEPVPVKIEDTAALVNEPMYSSIQNFGWDQTTDNVNIYVSLPEIHSLPTSSVTATFSAKTFDIKIMGLKGKCHRLLIKQLSHDVIPGKCHYKIKTDTLNISLSKKERNWWDAIPFKEPVLPTNRKKEKAADADPSASIMNLMKDLYDSGDDEMKRTIKKAWAEAEDKRRQGGDTSLQM